MNADPDSQSILINVIILVVLTLLNAFFAAAEMAVVSVNKSRVEAKADEGDKTSIKLLRLINDSGMFLSTIQVGITLVTLLQGASLANSFARKLAPLFGDATWAKQASQLIVLVLLTYISIVFGELYPKRIALNKSEEVARIVMGPIRALSVIMKPFVWLLSASTNFISRITPMKFDDENEKMTREEMAYILTNEGVLDQDELGMVKGIFDMDTTLAREVMVPRTEAFMIDIHHDSSENIDEILSSPFSRVPVYDDDKDKVIGILHLKNLLKEARKSGFENLDLLKVIHEPLFVPETIFIDDLLIELKRTQNHMAILLDEYGGVVGLVTLEDLLEEIVGEIDDESDELTVENLYKAIGQDEYIVQAKMPIDDFNETFGTSLNMNDVDTMAGYVITALGVIPEQDEELTVDAEHVTLTTNKVEGTRLLELKVKVHEIEEEPEEDKYRKLKGLTDKEKED
ncbi:HlyC/CorC family transporter [Vagococcus fluvialis]|uniref:hemolysin family protein n=1 Tax=Vagococcus fluvialis TaxID=2738 RepID=UPI001A8CACAA|nr:hemolysin family protein [Vagococcus fluvialis]MBO0479355.1 HlyC/CorC family transporter [Vagococcus fluvialis]MBO0485263.1 HlyC/CorC family transporter [Vagococcus fluvialis]